MSRDFLIVSLAALFAAAVMLLSIGLAAAAEPAAADRPTHFSRQVVEFDNSLASYRPAPAGKQPLSVTLVSTTRDGKP